MAPLWFRRTLQPGDTGNDVAVLQRKLGHTATGRFDAVTAQGVRGAQKAHGLTVTGVVDEELADALGESATADLLPRWYHRAVYPGMVGDDVRVLRILLDIPTDDIYDRAAEDAVRRLQSSRHIEPDGIVGEREALIIGDIEIETAPEG